MTDSLVHRGAPVETARAAVILVHGRGARAESMLELADEFDGADVAYLAPQAPGDAWYPYSFLAPIQQNEPYLSQALVQLGALIDQLNSKHISADQIALVGFSQGACLALEYAARHPRRYGGVIGLSGGLIGPPGTPRNYPGSLDGTPVFLGCSNVDPHIPKERVLETAQVLERMGGQVTTRIYPNMGHTVNADEVVFVRELVANLSAAS